MDLTTRGWAPCIRALAAAELLIPSCGSQAASRPSFSRARKAQPHSATPGQSQSSQNSSTPTKSA
ncbi:hypothetical protein LEMLEM_LOCUS10643 [Lemmus lemmus]